MESLQFVLDWYITLNSLLVFVSFKEITKEKLNLLKEVGCGIAAYYWF